MTSPQIQISGPTPGRPVPMEVHVDNGPQPFFHPKDDTPKSPDYELMMGDDFPG